MSAKSKSIILAESSKLIQQIGNSITLQLGARIQEIEALVRSIATAVEHLPKSEALIRQLIPPLIHFNGDEGIAGGGVWYEPYAFQADQVRQGFFWCRDRQTLKYLDSYNQSDRGYHQEAWYVVGRYLQPGQCFWSESYMDPHSYEPMVTCTAPLFGGGKFMGTVTVDLKLERLQSTVENFSKMTGGYIFVLDWKNKFLTFPKPEFVRKVADRQPDHPIEEFILADEFASQEPLFAPIAAVLSEMNCALLTKATDLPTYQTAAVEELSQRSDRICGSEAQLMAAAIADPLQTSAQQTTFYRQFELERDVLRREASTVFLFHMPRAYWKVVIVKPFSEAAMSTYSIIQAEKMSSLGQFVAGMAHEINNPISFVYGNLQHASAYMRDLLKLIALYQQHYPNSPPEIAALLRAIDFDFIRADLPKLFASMQVGTDRIRQLVLSLRNFSRTDESELKVVNIHEGINNTLLLLESRLNAKGSQPEITLVKEYGELPLVECYPGLLNQVLMNLLLNAIDAVEEQQAQQPDGYVPTVKICTERASADAIAIRVSDNGAGIPETLQSRLFDPFFTTKPIGKGTGLGLAICYQIITEKHGGQIQCFSSPGQGTQFLVAIPIQQNT